MDFHTHCISTNFILLQESQGYNTTFISKGMKKYLGQKSLFGHKLKGSLGYKLQPCGKNL